MSTRANIRLLNGAAALLAAAPVAAQTGDGVTGDTAPASAATAAVDAFGERVGIDQVGLYSEYQTRGFDLIANGGSFRLDGFYFSPAAFPAESLLAGASINVGIAATALDLPSPTGVLAYRLRDPGPTNALTVTTGIRDYETAHVEALGTAISEDGKWGIVGHTLIAPDAGRTTGERGPSVSVGAVTRWRPRPQTNLRLFGGYSASRYNGDIGVLAAAPGVPPPLRVGQSYNPAWARSRSQGVNAGMLLEHGWGRWSLGGGAIRSVSRPGRTDVSLLEIDQDGQVVRTVYHSPAVETRSDSIELKLRRDLALFGAQHRLGIAYRKRHTITGRALATAIPGGRFALSDRPVEVPLPSLPDDVPRGEDIVDQRIVSATYGLQIADRFQLRLGAHSNRYRKEVLDFEGGRSRQLETTWLYSASAIWQPDQSFRLFASYVSGLEESGVAPSVASNRGEVLPPVEAVQYEIGARYEVAPGLNLIVAGFSIKKAIFGLDAGNLFAPIGTVRHRGVEASLTGRLGPNSTIVLGANLVEPHLSGPQVEAGLVRKVAPGVSKFNATLSVEQRLGAGWSLDGYLLYEGPRRRDSLTATRVSGVPFAIVGARWDRMLGATPISLRAQVLNALDRKGYYATPGTALVPISPLTYRLLLTARF